MCCIPVLVLIFFFFYVGIFEFVLALYISMTFAEGFYFNTCVYFFSMDRGLCFIVFTFILMCVLHFTWLDVNTCTCLFSLWIFVFVHVNL